MILNLDNLRKLSWDIIGIYKLTNIYSNNIYIGQSKNIRKRLREHLEYMIANDYSKENESLINAWIKYNGFCFNFEQ